MTSAVLILACGDRSPLDGIPAPDASDAMVVADTTDSFATDPSCDCVAPPPWGWEFVAYDAQGRPDCPSGYDSPSDLVEASLDATNESCTCSCDPEAVGDPSYVPGTVWLDVGNSCGESHYFPASSGCNATSFSYEPGGPFDLATYAEGYCVGTCGKVKTTSVLPTLVTTETRACKIARPYGRCADYQVCLPASKSTDFMQCLMPIIPSDKCPAAFPVRHDTGTSASNASYCTADACACRPGGWNETLNVYSDTACATLSATIGVTGKCALASSTSLAFQSFEVSCSFPGTCGLSSPPGAQDEVRYVGQQMICCPQ